jgi:photosystem II stability/assembly factor-like uncharacterized protein
MAAVVNGRRIEGSVPGSAPILGLAATPQGFVIGTSGGVLTSDDGKTWTPVDEFSGSSLVAAAGSEVVVLNDGVLFRSSDLQTFTEVQGGLGSGTALTGTPEGNLYLARGPEDLLELDLEGGSQPVQIVEGPPEMLALAAGDGERPVMLAGGLSAGLWRSEDGGSRWSRILGTPIRSALVDRREPGRLMIGTAGGVLTSTPTRPWDFTGLRVAVEALAQTADGYVAVTADRLLYRSADGLEWETAAPVEE